MINLCESLKAVAKTPRTWREIFPHPVLQSDWRMDIFYGNKGNNKYF